jgi:hypothetical protein
MKKRGRGRPDGSKNKKQRTARERRDKLLVTCENDTHVSNETIRWRRFQLAKQARIARRTALLMEDEKGTAQEALEYNPDRHDQIIKSLHNSELGLERLKDEAVQKLLDEIRAEQDKWGATIKEFRKLAGWSDEEARAQEEWEREERARFLKDYLGG